MHKSDFKATRTAGKSTWCFTSAGCRRRQRLSSAHGSSTKKTGKSFNSGSKIMSLNAGTGQLQVFGYGYDGDVYFSNTGAMDLKDKKITWEMNEVIINMTKSKYTVTFSLENPNLLSVQMIDRVVDGKKQEEWIAKLRRKTKNSEK